MDMFSAALAIIAAICCSRLLGLRGRLGLRERALTSLDAFRVFEH